MPTQFPFVQPRTLWSWDTTGSMPVVTGYPQASGFAQTKTGLTASDLQNFVGVPLQFYGNPPIPVPTQTITQWLRWAEDKVETDTSVLLCQTWIAAPAAQTPDQATAIGVIPTTSAGYQIQGIDYDLADSAYDFMFKNAQDEAWMAQTLRYRPVQSLTYSATDYVAVKNTAYVYPLLNTFYRIPPSWNVEDRDFGYIRFVPSANVQMLPLFAMQLAFMGFAENVPGAIWFQYTAGLTPFDYQGRWSFMKELVLAWAAERALASIQGTINLGAKDVQTMVDGLQYRVSYDPNGPFAGLIKEFKSQREDLLKRAMNKVSGPMMTFI